MKQHILRIIILFAVVLGIFYLLATTTFVMSGAIPHLLKKAFNNVDLESLKIKKQSYRFPDTIALHDMEFFVNINGKRYSVGISRLVVYDIIKIWKARNQVKLSALGLNIASKNKEIKNADLRMILRFREGSAVRADGIINKAVFSSRGVDFYNTSAQILWDRTKFQVFEIITKVFGGDAQGQLLFNYYPVSNYVSWMEFSKCKPREIEKVYKNLFSDVEGELNGTFRMVGNKEVVDLLDVDFILQKGGVVKTSLLMNVLDDISDEGKRSDLKSFLENNEGIIVDEAVFHIGKSSSSTTATFSIDSSRHDLHLKEILDIKNIGTEIDKILLEK